MSGYPTRWIVYDCETTERRATDQVGTRELTFRLGCAVGYGLFYDSSPEGDGFELDRPSDFHWLIGQAYHDREPIYIFAHNHGFDARIVGFFRELALERYSLRPPPGDKRGRLPRDPLFLIDGSPFLLRLYRPDGQQLILLDTMNWLDCSLAKVGDMVGMPKGSVNFKECSDQELMTYCRRDVEITDMALKRVWGFCRSIGVKHWRHTLAAQAYQSFALRYSKGKIKMPEDQSLLALDRHAYYGGRVDCFRLGRIAGPVVQVDVNSMYPSLMMDGLFPVKIEEYQFEEGKRQEGPPPHPAQTTAEVWLDSPEVAYPVRTRDGVLYCRGKVRTVLCGPELRRAVELRHVHSYGRWVRYDMSRVFTRFVSDLWRVRMDARARGDRLGDRLAKMLMDSLYGKFGQRAGEWVTLGDDYPQDHYGHGVVVRPEGEDAIDWRVIAGVYQRKVRDTLADHAFVPIAAYVTSYGRVFMDAARSKLWEGGIYYQATDSLLLDQGNFDLLMAAGLVQGDEIGKFRRCDSWEWVDIKGLCHIDRAHHPLLGSLPAGATPVGQNVYGFDRWEGPTAGIYRGKHSSVSIRESFARLSQSYTRQESIGSGCLRPWAISNWRLTPEQGRKLPLSTHRDHRA